MKFIDDIAKFSNIVPKYTATFKMFLKMLYRGFLHTLYAQRVCFWQT